MEEHMQSLSNRQLENNAVAVQLGTARTPTRRRLTLRLTLTLLVLVSAIFVGTANAVPTTAICTPVQVMVWSGHIHVTCAPAVGAFSFFAVLTANPVNADRFCNLVTRAIVNSRKMTIVYDPAVTTFTACNQTNCREALAYGLQ